MEDGDRHRSIALVSVKVSGGHADDLENDLTPLPLFNSFAIKSGLPLVLGVGVDEQVVECLLRIKWAELHADIFAKSLVVHDVVRLVRFVVVDSNAIVYIFKPRSVV